MNIKSLLLGSAAALAVVSGAQAADAIVAAEPEPMEYVRVCDAFGTGYFYIPGTETCIKIGGKVRYDAEAADSYTPDSDNGWRKKSRAEITVDTASDTEWGALKTNIIARWDWFTNGRTTSGTVVDADGNPTGDFADDIGLGNTDAKLIAANITLGGFLVGLADSQYSAFPGYAGDIINDDVISYGQFERNQISYTYDAGNGFSIVGAFEDRGQFGNNEYLPNMVAGVGYTTGAFGFHLVGGYDAEEEEGGIKGRIDATFGSFSAFYMAAWNSDGDTTNAYAPGDSIGQSWGDWAMWGGVGAKFTDNLGANFQAALTDNDTIALAANLKWEVVPGLLIQPEVTWTKWDGEDGGAGTVDIDDDQWNGMVRFQRSF